MLVVEHTRAWGMTSDIKLRIIEGMVRLSVTLKGIRTEHCSLTALKGSDAKRCLDNFESGETLCQLAK